MLGLLLVASLTGLVLWIAARRRPPRLLGAGLCVLSFLILGWIIALLRADDPPDPLPAVQRITSPPTIV